MNRSSKDADFAEELYHIHARRESTTARPAQRKSPRFAKRNSSQQTFNGAHRRGNKRCGL